MKRQFCALFVLLLAFVAVASAQRLPETAIPSHYSLQLEPNFGNDTFSGDETIDISVPKSTSSITLNAADITFEKTSVSVSGKAQTASVSLDPKDEMATLTLPSAIPAGPAQIHIRYTGILNNKLRGFYRSEAHGLKYAVTQFEATDARRAFPSFDEPAYKATFDITLIVPKADTAISNGKIVSDTPGPGPNQHTIKFSTSPKMSTYLVAMLVGQFDCVAGSSDNVPIRVCTVPGKQQLGTFALKWAEDILHYYDNYYGIKYPFGKLDLIGIPDFEAGAMENTAAITYREDDLLVDPSTSTTDHEKNVALVIAHEMAHQWFGDLVTMKWWNDIWLNEGFATWMETKPVAALKPEWGIPQDEETSDIGAMRTDSLPATRAIRTNAETPAQINALFDAIAYNKTAAVLRMVESYLTPEVFRKGVNEYLQAHAYGNATAEDFWTKLAQVSTKPVDRIMESYVDQPGMPIVTLDAACANGESTLHQKRFFLDTREAPQTAQVWSTPVCMSDGTGQPVNCELLSQAVQKIKLPGCKIPLNQNAGAHGYYRSGYTPQQSDAIARSFETAFNPVERLSVLENEWELVRAGDHPIQNFMDMARKVDQDRTHGVWNNLQGHLQAIDENLITPADRANFHEFARNLARPVIDQLGWSVRPGDSYEVRSVRASAFGILGYFAADPQAIAQARKLVDAYLVKPTSVDPALAAEAFTIAARNGDAVLYNKFVAAMKTAKSPSVYYRYLYSLTAFRDPALVQRTIELALSPQIRSQDMPFLLAGSLMNPAGRGVAWRSMETHWPQIEQKMSAFGPVILLYASGSFCDPQSRSQVNQFFTEHRLPGAQRALQQSLEQIDSCISFKAAQQPGLASWLTQQPTAAAR
jgi:aminopeptidase N